MLAGVELARIYANMNEFSTARRLADVATKCASDLDQAFMICVAQDALAYLHGLNGEWQQALESRQVTVEAARGSDNRLIPMINNPGLAEALLETGRADEAARHLEEGLATHESEQSAASTLKRSLEIFEAAGAKYWVDRTVAAIEELSGGGASSALRSAQR